ncbi:unnamed protein product [Heterobilharzia americana]|nr:unnamed protein product [Heterobilharzia americana]
MLTLKVEILLKFINVLHEQIILLLERISAPHFPVMYKKYFSKLKYHPADKQMQLEMYNYLLLCNVEISSF